MSPVAVPISVRCPPDVHLTCMIRLIRVHSTIPYVKGVVGHRGSVSGVVIVVDEGGSSLHRATEGDRSALATLLALEHSLWADNKESLTLLLMFSQQAVNQAFLCIADSEAKLKRAQP